MYYYHVRITRKSEPSHDIVALDLSQDQLRKRVLQPYENGNPIVIRGTTIPTDDLKQIRINRTQDHSSKILPIVQADRAQSRVVVSISDDWFVADKGEDVTDGLITAPRGQARARKAMKDRLQAYKDFEGRIATALEKAGFRIRANPEIGGLRPDFLVWGPDETTYVIELKSWAPTPQNKSRAIQQSERYREATGADYAYVVLDGLKRSIPSEGLLAERDLIRFLTKEVAERGVRPREKKIELPQRQQRTIFAAMPFDPEFDDVFFIAIAEAAKSVSAVAIREDKQEFAGDIVEQIKRDIRDSSVIVADLSESKADVLYEVGFAHALDKPTVHICSTPLNKLPFDVRNVNTIKYVKGQTHRLRGVLETRLRAIVTSS